MNVKTARLMTNVLAGTCGALLLLALVQYAGLGRGYRWAPDAEGEAARLAVGAIDRQPVQLPPATAFADIQAHPLFNEDRKPTPLDLSEGQEAAAPPSPLNVALTGVILDEKNHVRIAMLQDKARNQPVALKVGMPLEGDQASWMLVDLKPRLAVFRNAANETAEVELETALAPTSAPGAARPQPPRAGAAPAAGGAAPATPPGAPGAKAAPPGTADASADLARRIEERRRQMREEAEKLRNAKPQK
jgi:general secretion pathway protein N